MTAMSSDPAWDEVSEWTIAAVAGRTAAALEGVGAVYELTRNLPWVADLGEYSCHE